jgi:hypothetical protein
VVVAVAVVVAHEDEYPADGHTVHPQSLWVIATVDPAEADLRRERAVSGLGLIDRSLGRVLAFPGPDR